METVKIGFNPYMPGQYEEVVHVYIDDPDLPKNQPYADLVLKGEGAFPRLKFDRKEIVLPVVPLGIEA